LLFGYFAAFFIAASQLRMDAVLAATEMGMRRASALDGDDMSRIGDPLLRSTETGMSADALSDDSSIDEFLPDVHIPRVTATQVALLPRRPGDPPLLASIFRPLSAKYSARYTNLEWCSTAGTSCWRCRFFGCATPSWSKATPRFDICGTITWRA
jgi:hypothetical protein